MFIDSLGVIDLSNVTNLSSIIDSSDITDLSCIGSLSIDFISYYSSSNTDLSIIIGLSNIIWFIRYYLFINIIILLIIILYIYVLISRISFYSRIFYSCQINSLEFSKNYFYI